MKIQLKQVLFILSFLLSNIIFGQEKVELIDVNDITSKILAFEKDGEYQKALDELEKVPKNDSAYFSFLTSKSYYQVQLGNYEEAIKLSEEGLSSTDHDLYYYFILNNAVSYLNLKQYQKSIEQYDKALEMFPKNYLFYYNKGVAYEGLNKFDEASKMYQISISCNPYYANSHLKLGNLCYQQHLIAQAMMCFDMYLLLNPDGENSINVLTFSNNMVAKKNENEKVPNVKISVDDDSFEEIDLIINNYAALSKSYKINNKIDLALVKQNHALFNQLKTYKGNGGFWDKYYVPFYLYVNNSYFDPFVYTICYSAKNEKLKAIVDKNITEIKSFIAAYQKKWLEILELQEDVVDGNLKPVHTLYVDGKIDGFGEYKNNKEFGKWTFFRSNGSISGIGYYDENGEKTGKWTWFNKKGDRDETAVYKDGKPNGEYYYYFDNGKVNIHSSYMDGKLSGDYEKYNEEGALKEKYTNVDGNIDGKYLSFYPIGKGFTEYKIPYKKGKIEGTAYQYFPDGKIQNEIAFKDGNINGTDKKYYYNGQLEYKKEYKENLLVGEYVEYHPNGNVSTSGICVDGFYEGPFNIFYPNNKIESELNYSKGKIVGIMKNYDTDGKLHYEFTYRDGEIIAYKFYSKNGDILKEAKKQKGEFYYVGYAPDGNITSEGLYDISGGKKGNWKFYTRNKVLETNEFLTDGQLNGEHTNYYKNGKISNISTYMNDTLNGYYSSFYSQGQLKQQGWYLKGQAVGLWISYFVDGTIESKDYYSNDKLNGLQENYNVDGKLSYKNEYDRGKLIHEYYYDQTGNLVEDINLIKDSASYQLVNIYTNGKVQNNFSMLYKVRNGLYKGYYFDGAPKADGNYLNGEKSGEWKWYHSNGKIETKGTYLYGNKDGIWTDYFENGKVESETPYFFGKREGIEKTFNDAGVLVQTRQFENDVLNGEVVFFSEEGKHQLTRFYINGKIIGYSYFDKTGNKIPMIPIENETAKVVGYFDNGKISREFEMVNGNFINKYNEYYYTGQLFEEQTYQDDNRQGLNKQYFPDGKVKLERNFNQDIQHGESKEYFADGKVKKIIPYLNGVINGTVKTYDTTGKLILEETYFDDEVIAMKKY